MTAAEVHNDCLAVVPLAKGIAVGRLDGSDRRRLPNPSAKKLKSLRTRSS